MANRFLHLVRHGEAIDDGDLTERGRRQATLLGRRLAGLRITAIHHSPLRRAVQTARLISECLPDVPVRASELVGDYFPPVRNSAEAGTAGLAPDPGTLPDVYARFLDGITTEEFAAGARLAAAAIERHAVTAEADSHEVIVTHNFLIGWFIRHALDAPAWRWLGLNQGNASLTTILYRPDRPPAVVLVNDMGHLPPDLRWTGFPPEHHI